MVIQHSLPERPIIPYIYSNNKLSSCEISSLNFPHILFCSPALFGKTIFSLNSSVYIPPRATYYGTVEGKEYIKTHTENNAEGCIPLYNDTSIKGKILYLDRGGCSFSLKAKNAQDAGAIGLIVGNIDNDNLFTMSSTPINNITVIINIPVVMIKKSDTFIIKSFLKQNPYSECNISLHSEILRKSRIKVKKETYGTSINGINYKITLTQLPGMNYAQMSVSLPDNN